MKDLQTLNRELAANVTGAIERLQFAQRHYVSQLPGTNFNEQFDKLIKSLANYQNDLMAEIVAYDEV